MTDFSPQPAAILSRQRGASLLEGIAYLGIAAIVILGAVSLLTGAFSSAQSNRVSEEIVSIRTGVKKLYSSQSSGYGTADLNATLVSAKVFPSTLTATAAGAATNSWGGSVTVTGATSTFNIVYTGVPQDVCINALSGATGWASITGNANAAITTFPVTPADAAAACSVSTSAGNTITWASN
ncbi:Tfp pilus assembly protein PilW [Actimicrobium sp. GrIS 1.19]|uniref:type 4 pilus major pilin n=1 Tax=Actimicrobium sp. GrIS 1.19 TaxID=3071708 RepID=UPI002DF8C25C|nr:Tfp pilus assembly protein PilW [Actimicrobium sp. GrIS 1.19]